MTTFQPLHFIPPTRQTQILATPIASVRAVGHTQEGGTNHWCFYLETTPSTSIQLDCQPVNQVTVFPALISQMARRHSSLYPSWNAFSLMMSSQA